MILDVVSMQVSDEELIKIDGLEFRALFTPGHTSLICLIAQNIRNQNLSFLLLSF